MRLESLTIHQSSFLLLALRAYTILTHGNLTGTEQVTVVANSVHRYYRSVPLGIVNPDTARRPG
jgi:hypothetical protein